MKKWLCAIPVLFLIFACVYWFIFRDTNDKRARIHALVIERQLMEKLRTGDVICRKGNGVWSYLFANMSSRDRRFCHVGLVLVDTNSEVKVIHAEANDFTGVGEVYEQSLEDFLYGGDAAGVYRLKNEFAAAFTRETEFIALARKYLKLPFDYGFDFSNRDRVYCTEYVYEVFQQMNPPVELALAQKKDKVFLPVDSCNDPAFFEELEILEYVSPGEE